MFFCDSRWNNSWYFPVYHSLIFFWIMETPPLISMSFGSGSHSSLLLLCTGLKMSLRRDCFQKDESLNLDKSLLRQNFYWNQDLFWWNRNWEFFYILLEFHPFCFTNHDSAEPVLYFPKHIQTIFELNPIFTTMTIKNIVSFCFSFEKRY